MKLRVAFPHEVALALRGREDVVANYQRRVVEQGQGLYEAATRSKALLHGICRQRGRHCGGRCGEL